MSKSNAICEHCGKTFTPRGMSLHQRKCSKKLAHNKAEVKKTRSYKFCILNESAHEEVLSFLGNQTLTKMQLITGDRYGGCEPELAEICCKCENDNVTIDRHLCRQCVQGRPFYRDSVTKKVANTLYGVKLKDFSDFPSERHGSSRVYERITLEKFMLKCCGSKKEWLRRIVNVRTRSKSVKAVRSRRKYLHSFLSTRSPELARLAKTAHYDDLDVNAYHKWYPRFEALQAAFKHCSLPLKLSSKPAKDFIKNGIGSVEDVVNGVRQN